MSPPPPLAIRDLTVRHGHRLALDHVSATVTDGTSVAVIGSNGSGKSTLLRAIAGLQTVASGTVEPGPRRVALVPQSVTVDRSLPITVRETVRLGRCARRGAFRRFTRTDATAIDAAMERLGIEDLADRSIHELSGGQRQRALVAQGLVQDAPILLLDEPMTGLDVPSRQVILEVIDAHRDGGGIVLVATHELDDAARSDHVLLLATRCIAQGSPDVVLTEEHLAEAFAGRVHTHDDGEVFIDDPHHPHDRTHT